MIIYQIDGEILSPVHIGTGEIWEPLEYFIDVNDDKLYHFLTENVIEKFNDSERITLNKMIDSENLNSLRNFISTKAKDSGVFEKKDSISVVKAISYLYQKNLQNIENQLQIQPMIRQKGNGCVMIPGSSLKGAIRTAIVSELALKSGLPKPKPFGREVYEFESKVLRYNDATNDPFRALKITDAHLKSDSTIICQIFNAGKDKKGQLNQKSMQLIYETTKSFVSSQVQCAFSFEISFDDQLLEKNSYINYKISAENLMQSCNRFYQDKMKMEHDKFYQDSPIDEVSAQLQNFVYKENECLIRLGRFSGVESVTLDEYRNPQPPGREKKYGNTRNIADRRYPMGWVKLCFHKKK